MAANARERTPPGRVLRSRKGGTDLAVKCGLGVDGDAAEVVPAPPHLGKVSTVRSEGPAGLPQGQAGSPRDRSSRLRHGKLRFTKKTKIKNLSYSIPQS